MCEVRDCRRGGAEPMQPKKKLKSNSAFGSGDLQTRASRRRYLVHSTERERSLANPTCARERDLVGGLGLMV